MQEGERASSLLPQEDTGDKGKGLRTQKKGKVGAGRGSGGKVKKMSLLGPTALARGVHSWPLSWTDGNVESCFTSLGAKECSVRDPTEAMPEDREQCIFAYLPHHDDRQKLIYSTSCGLMPADISEAETGGVSDSAELLHCYCQRVFSNASAHIGSAMRERKV